MRREGNDPSAGPVAAAAPEFERLYRQSAPRVLGLCRRMMRSGAAAEDAAAEAFLRAHRAWCDYDPERPFANWVLTIAARVCLDRLRRRALERRLFADGADRTPQAAAPDAGPLARLLAGERRRQVRRAVAVLPERYRQVLVLRYYAELRYEEIAGLLGLKRNHVAILIHRAKQRLRRSLEATAEEATS